VILALVLGTIVADAPALTLDGISLGTKASDFTSAHKGAVAAKSAAGAIWTAKRPGGGTIRVTGDGDGNVAIVDVTLAGDAGAIDLPAARGFSIASSHDKYSDASSYVESDSCTTNVSGAACFAYTLEGDTELLLTFAANGNGPLREALWGDRSLIKDLGLITAGATP
jgi:hypothetical protein